MSVNKVLSLMSAALMFGALPLMGCHDNSSGIDSAAPQLAAQSVGRDGGEKVDGDLIGIDVKEISRLGGTMKVSSTTLVVPPRAVDWTYRCTFKLYAKMPPAGLTNALNRVYDFGPEGTEFQIPATLSVPFSDTDLGTADPLLYKCYYYNTSHRRYEVQSTAVDLVGRRFLVVINHFSLYAFGRVNE